MGSLLEAAMKKIFLAIASVSILFFNFVDAKNTRKQLCAGRTKLAISNSTSYNLDVTAPCFVNNQTARFAPGEKKEIPLNENTSVCEVTVITYDADKSAQFTFDASACRHISKKSMGFDSIKSQNNQELYYGIVDMK